MRQLLLIPVLALLAGPLLAEDAKFNEEVVKDVRALYAATRAKDVASAKQKLLSRKDLDWPSVREGLIQGAYYRAPMHGRFGIRHSGKHMNLHLRGDDGKERGFSLFVPKSYNAKDKIPVLFYLHHGSYSPEPRHGATAVFTALNRFKKLADEHGVLFVAPYTSTGAEWWTEEGKRLVEWTLERVKERYNIDEDRVALLGPQDGASGVWALGQTMPGTWSCLMPMSGNHYSTSAMVRPLYLGTLDRMDILMGVPGLLKGRLGDVNTNQYLAGLKPLFDQGMRITTVIAPRSPGDFRYLDRIGDDIMTWAKTKKRKARADEVDIDSDGPLRSLWLTSHGVDPEGPVAHNFKSTHLRWNPGEAKDPDPKLGVHIGRPNHWKVGVNVNRVTKGAAMNERILAGDIIVEIGNAPIRKPEDVKAAMKGVKFGQEVRVLLVREVKEDELERMKKRQAFYLKRAVQRRAMRAENKPIPEDFMDYVEEDEGDDEDDDDEGCTTIEMGGGGNAGGGGGNAGGGKDEKVKTVMFAFERFAFLRRPEGDNIVRADFGAQWDRSYRGKGVRVKGVFPGTHAFTAGLRNGDVIIAAGSEAVKGPADLRRFFKDFKFEKADKDKRFVEFTVQRGHNEQTVHAEWNPVASGRVDARWDRKENALHVLVRHCKGFTVHFTDEHIEPGRDFYLYINGIPYQDLVDPASAPKYPHPRPGSDSWVGEKLRMMLRKRALMKGGWQPDIKWAVETALEWRDRSLVVGNKLSIDLTTLKEGFEARKKRQGNRGNKRAARIEKAYEEFKAKDQG